MLEEGIWSERSWGGDSGMNLSMLRGSVDCSLCGTWGFGA